jgi:hypothetical protein
MEIVINLNGKKRKELAVAIGELLNTTPEYQKAPTHAYCFGEGVELDRNNTLIISGNANPAKVRELAEMLEEKGFLVESLPDKLIIQMPLKDFDSVSLDNLKRLVAAKSELIKTALGVEELPIEQSEETLDFAWFAFETPPNDITAYSQFISALCEMAKKQKRVLATEKSVENQKYAFRCFLLRLGFIGDEYSDTRKILLRNLTGNGSMKGGEKSERQPTAPSPTKSEASAEAIAKHLLRGLFEYIEMGV